MDYRTAVLESVADAIGKLWHVHAYAAQHNATSPGHT